MLKLDKSQSVIYIYCPANTVTGGPEALHQLAFKLSLGGFNTKIVYYFSSHTKNTLEIKQPEIYTQYYGNIEYIAEDKVVDSNMNLIIVPEICISKLDNFLLIQKSIRWLSVDNAEKRGIPFLKRLCEKQNKKSLLYRAYTYYNYFYGRILIPSDGNIFHLVQSKYAEYWLLKNIKRPRIYSLSDYLNIEFIKDCFCIEKKENIVVYNPKKGFKFTKKLISKYGDKIKFVPIENMSPTQVQQLLQKAKIYIDFGHHPGKDRIPRESVLQGWCLITNMRGSAKYFADIPVLSKYTFQIFSPARIYQLIGEIFDNYEDSYQDFLYYRSVILKGEEIFENEVKNFFNI